jgi:site-specific DNA-cytosine methylase
LTHQSVNNGHLIPSWWDGGQTAATLTKQNAGGNQRMPDKDNFGAVIEQVAQPIAYSFDSLASNSMKSPNPHSGCREVETSKTIDTTTPEPSKNQGGIAIVQPIAVHKVSPTITAKMQGMSGWAPYNETEHLVPVAQPITMEKIAGPIDASYYKGQGSRQGGEREFVAQPKAAAFIVAKGSTSRSIGYREENAPTLVADQGNNSAVLCPSPVAQLQYFENHAQDSRVTGPHDIGNAVSAKYGTGGGNTPIVSQPIAVDCFNQTINEKTTQTIGSSASDINHIGGVLQTMAIRRLTPKECERLQGFPDDWTKIPYRNKPAEQCPDGPRYKACGNSMAVPVMRWIGERIQMIENYLNP